MYVRHTTTTIVLYYFLSVYYFIDSVSPLLPWELQKEVVSYIISVSYFRIILHYIKLTLLLFGSFNTISDILCTIIIVFVCTTLVLSVGLFGRSFFESQKVVTNKFLIFSDFLAPIIYWLCLGTASHCMEHWRHMYSLCPPPPPTMYNYFTMYYYK